MTKHTVYTLCHSCGKWGCNLPGVQECGNCGSKDTMEYRSKADIISLLYRAYEVGVGGGSTSDLIRWAQELEAEGEL